MSIQLDVTTENLLSAVAKMPEVDFNRFVEKARKMRKVSGRISGKEADLLHKINTVFPTEKRLRYDSLYERFRSDDLSEKEHKELVKLSDEFEVLNVKRLEYVGKLASIRNQLLRDVINDLGLKPQR